MSTHGGDIMNYLFHEGVIDTAEMVDFSATFSVTDFYQSSYTEFITHGLMESFFNQAIVKTYGELTARPLTYSEGEAIFGDSTLYPLIARTLWDHMHRAVRSNDDSVFVTSPFVDWVTTQAIGPHTQSNDIGGVLSYFLQSLQNEYNYLVAAHNRETFDKSPFLTIVLIEPEQSIFLKNSCFDIVWSFGSDLKSIRESGDVWEVFPTAP